VGLKTSRRSVRLLSYVEDDGMGVKLRRGIAFNGTGGIVFKSGSNKLASRLRRVNIADMGLCGSFLAREAPSGRFRDGLPEPVHRLPQVR